MKRIVSILLAIVILCSMAVYADAVTNVAITNCEQNIANESLDITVSVPQSALQLTLIVSRRPLSDFANIGDARGSIISFMQYDAIPSMPIQIGYLTQEPQNTSTVYVYANCGDEYIASISVPLKNQNNFIIESFKNAASWNLYPQLVSNYNKNFGMFTLSSAQLAAVSKFSDIETSNVYKAMYLAKDRFMSVADIEAAYFSAVDTVIAARKEQSNNSGFGGGGGGGGGGGLLIPTPSENLQPDIKPEVKPTENTIFSDLDKEAWAKDAIEYLYKNGIVNGVEENKFAPSRVLKREEFITMLIRGAKLEALNDGVEFKDVPKDSYFAEYVKVAVSRGIVNGIDGNNFGAGLDLKRQDLAVMIYRAFFNGVVPESDLEPKDIDAVSDYAKTAVRVLMEKGIVNGMGDGRFAPDDNSNRAQAAQLIYNLILKGII